MEALKFDVNKLIEFVQKDWYLGDLHGLSHWQRVHKNGCLLYTDGVDINVVVAFAYLHDSARRSDGGDIDHGVRAVDNVKKLRNTILVNFTNEEIELLCEACRLHTVELKTGNITIDTCFDSDRLDLDRCYIIPKPHRMATKKGAEYAENFEEFKKMRDL